MSMRRQRNLLFVRTFGLHSYDQLSVDREERIQIEGGRERGEKEERVMRDSVFSRVNPRRGRNQREDR